MYNAYMRLCDYQSYLIILLHLYFILRNHLAPDKIVFSISNKKTKTSELLLIKHIVTSFCVTRFRNSRIPDLINFRVTKEF